MKNKILEKVNAIISLPAYWLVALIFGIGLVVLFIFWFFAVCTIVVGPMLIFVSVLWFLNGDLSLLALITNSFFYLVISKASLLIAKNGPNLLKILSKETAKFLDVVKEQVPELF